MARRQPRRYVLVALFVVVLVGTLALVDVASLHPALETATDAFWNVLFWVLVLVVLALLVWSIFPTPRS